MELVALNVNGRTYNIAVEKNWTLLYTLREVMDLTGTKCGCSTGSATVTELKRKPRLKNRQIIAVKRFR